MINNRKEKIVLRLNEERGNRNWIRKIKELDKEKEELQLFIKNTALWEEERERYRVKLVKYLEELEKWHTYFEVYNVAI